MATNFELTADKSNITIEQFFKSTKDDAGNTVKRDAIKVTLPVVPADSVTPEQAQVLAHELVAQFAKKLIAARSTDWNYLPSAEDCNFQLAYADLVAPSVRGFRKLSAAVLAQLVTLYAAWGTEAGKSQIACSNGQKILASRLRELAGIPDEQVLLAFAGNLQSFAEWIASRNYPDDLQIGAEELCNLMAELIESKSRKIEVSDI